MDNRLVDPKIKNRALNYLFKHNATYESVVKRHKGAFTLQTLMRWAKADSRFESRRGNWSFMDEVTKTEVIKRYTVNRQKPCQIAKELGINSVSSVVWHIRKFKKYGKDSLVVKRKDAKIKKPKDMDSKDWEIYQLKLENDMLRAMFEVVDDPKVQGLRLENLTVNQKTQMIQVLRPNYQFLKDLLDFLHLEKSAYDYSRKSKKKEMKDKSAREWILHVFKTVPKAKNNYGYRKVRDHLRNLGVIISEKVIQKWMNKLNLSPKVKRCRKYYSYLGRVGKVAPNLLDRDFKANLPNQKWVTDITEFHLNGFKVYLSPMIDLFNGEVIAWTISQSPNMKLVLEMLEEALSKLNEWDNPFVHSDQGHQYQRPAYVEMLEKNGCIQSMSRKGTSPDNAAAEGFFGTLKREFFYNNDYSNCTYEQFVEKLDDWIDWYNKERPKTTLNGLSPVRYRVNFQKCIMFDVVPKTINKLMLES